MYHIQLQASYDSRSDNGILPEYTIAVIEDDTAPTYNPMGDHDEHGVKQYDGSTFVSPETMYLENNSLGGAKVGVDKKPFIHFYKEGSATGGIIKTAGFALTNFTMRNTKFYQRMVKKMWGKTWEFEGSLFNDNVLVDSRAISYLMRMFITKELMVNFI